MYVVIQVIHILLVYIYLFISTSTFNCVRVCVRDVCTCICMYEGICKPFYTDMLLLMSRYKYLI
jgi:hypothetical protein